MENSSLWTVSRWSREKRLCSCGCCSWRFSRFWRTGRWCLVRTWGGGVVLEPIPHLANFLHFCYFLYYTRLWPIVIQRRTGQSHLTWPVKFWSIFGRGMVLLWAASFCVDGLYWRTPWSYFCSFQCENNSSSLEVGDVSFSKKLGGSASRLVEIILDTFNLFLLAVLSGSIMILLLNLNPRCRKLHDDDFFDGKLSSRIASVKFLKLTTNCGWIVLKESITRCLCCALELPKLLWKPCFTSIGTIFT